MCFALPAAQDPFLNFIPTRLAKTKLKFPSMVLIWMGEQQFMLDQLEEKLAQGFSCIKMKVGAIAFEQELAILKQIRARYSKEEMVLRVDANGAFGDDAPAKLQQLAELDLHSIEQPFPKGIGKEMRKLCASTPFDRSP